MPGCFCLLSSWYNTFVSKDMEDGSPGIWLKNDVFMFFSTFACEISLECSRNVHRDRCKINLNTFTDRKKLLAPNKNVNHGSYKKLIENLPQAYYITFAPFQNSIFYKMHRLNYASAF